MALRRLVTALSLALLLGSFLTKPGAVGIEERLERRDRILEFDPRYRSFLVAVERGTPREATVVLVTPPGRPYLYIGAYVLAPRRVLEEDAAVRGGYLAVYGRDPLGMPGAIEIPGGFLLRQ